MSATAAPGTATTVMDGNKAAACGAMLCRPQLLATYPITPQTPLVEYLAQFVARGELAATLVTAESEHSVMSILQGAMLAGSRVFTGTSGQGLALMYEPYMLTATLRLPMVMAIATREMMGPSTVWGGQQDALTLRDAGWIQLFVEDNQELLDSVILAFRLAEDPRVLLPVNVCYDGFYLSHLTEAVAVPTQEAVDAFLPPYDPKHLKLDPDVAVAINGLVPGDLMMEYRYKHLRAMHEAKVVIDELDAAFGRHFGRSYGGLVERYRLDDAALALVTMGSFSGTAKVAVDRAREAGVPVGLLKVRAMRPFPREAVAAALRDKAAVGVVDRNVCFGWSSGIVHVELRAALRDLERAPLVLGFIDGLGGADIPLAHLSRAIEIVAAAAAGQAQREVTWLGIANDSG